MLPRIPTAAPTGAGAGAGGTCTGDSKCIIEVDHHTKYEVNPGKKDVTDQHCYVCYLEFLQMHLQVQMAPVLVTVRCY